MKQHTRKTKIKRSGLSLCIASALGLTTPFLSIAQVSQSEAEEAIETIKVTGSKIPQDPNATSSVPIQSLDREQIALSGELNLADIVNDIPALISSNTAENNDTGSNSLNLRGLGSERTLTLVNGRRHVAGFRGTQAVDVGTIPRALVDRVEVTTGGASAVYGADAVTGVVNFVLKDDFEGFQVDVTGARPEESGGSSYAIDVAYGKNFDNDKGNIVFTVSVEQEEELLHKDREWSRNNGIYADVNNPDYDPEDPNSPQRIVATDIRYWLSSNQGSIAPGFGSASRQVNYVDINNNGIADCQESEAGRSSFLSGCWITNPDGSVSVNSNGPVYTGLLSSGGSGAKFNFDNDTLMPDTDKTIVNINGNYDFTDDLRGFFEAKYVRAVSNFLQEYDSYYDTLFIQPDNPFIPEQLLPVNEQTGGLLLTQDVSGWDNDDTVYERETARFVAGFEWDYSINHSLEFSFNHGRFTNKTSYTEAYLDRVFAAIDAIEGPDGAIVCRSDLDPTAAYEIDYFTAGNGFADGGFSSDVYYSFTPGDGQCAPLNPFGINAISQEAQDFINVRKQDELTIEQTVFSLVGVGQFEVAENFLDDAIGYAAGIEYREESSDNRLDPVELGLLPQGTPFSAGQNVNEVSPWLFSLTDIDNSQFFNTKGEYDVIDAFLEVRVPIFLDRAFANEFTVDGAVRVSDYSTLGNTTTWKFGLTYSPIEDISVRGTISEAVRAPNITELFDPQLPITINLDEDPCDPSKINAGTANRIPNCIAGLEAAGVPRSDIVDGDGNFIWVNPLTARFAGTSGGNPELDVETAETLTIGAVFTPSFAEGLIVTVDYWDIEIEDAIEAVGDTEILNGCYDSNNFPAVGFCEQFERRSDGGLSDLTTGDINFARIEAEGYDVSIAYQFSVEENEFGITLVGTKQEQLDRFFNALDPNDVNPELEEIQVPKTSGNISLNWSRENISVNWQTTYQSRQAVAEIEAVLGLNGNQELFGPGGSLDGFFGSTVIHDLNVSYQIQDGLSVFGGINNLSDKAPFRTQEAWPTGPRGRTLFLGFSYTL